MITDDDIKKIIKESISPEKKTKKLDESYVAAEKVFKLNTEFLSEANKQNHIELYDGYVTEFNEISARLDSTNRLDANSNNSAYRSLKVDV